MRIAKIPAEIVEAKVLESLRSRMDPVTRRVYPRWKQMMREIGVCRQRIADAVKSLKGESGARPRLGWWFLREDCGFLRVSDCDVGVWHNCLRRRTKTSQSADQNHGRVGPKPR